MPSDGISPVVIAVIVVGVLAAIAVGYRVGFAGNRTSAPGGGKVGLVYEDVLSGKETRYKIVSERTSIGRSPSNDVTLLDPQQRISREHAAIEARGQKWVIIDLNSRVGVEVNGEKIDGTQAIFDGDFISIGNLQMRFDAPGFARSDQDRLETIVEVLPDDLPPPVSQKRTTRIKEGGPSEDDTDKIETVLHAPPPEPKRRVTMLKEDSTDEDIIGRATMESPPGPRTTAIKPNADPPEEDSDQTPLNAATPAINPPRADDEDLRDTTRPERPGAEADPPDEDD